MGFFRGDGGGFCWQRKLQFCGFLFVVVVVGFCRGGNGLCLDWWWWWVFAVVAMGSGLYGSFGGLCFMWLRRWVAAAMASCGVDNWVFLPIVLV